jgi:hypothetical protein
MIAGELVLADPARFKSLILSSTYAQFHRQAFLRLRHLSLREVAYQLGHLMTTTTTTASPSSCDFEAKMKMKMVANLEQMHGSKVHNNKSRYREVFDAKLQQKLRQVKLTLS